MLSMRHLELLAARGLDPETLLRFGVESCSDRGGDWIAIPVTRGGTAVNVRYRTIAGDKRFAQEKDALRCFWNSDVLQDETLAGERLVVTEGELDAMIAVQCGFARTVSVPDGAPAVPVGERDSRRYDFLDLDEAALRRVREIVLATDADEPGRALLQDLATRLGRARCRVAAYPQGCKDLNDVYLAAGEQGVRAAIEGAPWLEVKGLFRMSELEPVEEPAAHDIGIAGLARHYRIRRGDLAVITGIPGHGKTTLVNEIAGRVALMGWNVCFASFEQRPQTDHRRALRTFFAGKRVIRQNAAECAAADDWIDRHFSFVVPDDDTEASLDWVLDAAAAATARYGADMPLTEYTGLAIRLMKQFALRRRVHLIVVAHPAKLQRQKDGRIPVPTLYDIADSAHWHNKPDVGVIVHRMDDDRTLIRVDKARFEAIGVRGELFGRFDPKTACYRMDGATSHPPGEARGREA
jgi:twinkle protein